MLASAKRVLNNLYYHYARVQEVVNNLAELNMTIHCYTIYVHGRICSFKESFVA
jgi:hypothetical protein